MSTLFYVSSPSRPKRVAKELRDHLFEAGYQVPHTKCLEIIARMYGHADWRALEASIGKQPPSPDDVDVSDKEVLDRRTQQMDALIEVGIPGKLAGQITNIIHATSKKLIGLRHDNLHLASIEKLLATCRRAVDNRWHMDLTDAAQQGLELAEGHHKRPFVEALEAGAAFSYGPLIALGLACMDGRIGAKDAARGRRYLERALEMASQDHHPGAVEALCRIRCELGEAAFLAGDEERGVMHYEIAANLYGDPMAAVWSSLDHIKKDPGEFRRYMEIIVESGDESCIRQIRDVLKGGTVPSTKDDIAFVNVQLDKLRKDGRTQNDDGFNLIEVRQMRTGFGFDAKFWFDLLQQHGWEVDLIAPVVADGRPFAIATSEDGLKIPIRISGARMMMDDDDPDDLIEHAKSLRREPTALLLFTDVRETVWRSDEPQKRAVPIGIAKFDETWRPFYLHAGGLDEVMRQHRLRNQLGGEDIGYDGVANPDAVDVLDRIRINGEAIGARMLDVLRSASERGDDAARILTAQAKEAGFDISAPTFR